METHIKFFILGINSRFTCEKQKLCWKFSKFPNIQRMAVLNG